MAALVLVLGFYTYCLQYLDSYCQPKVDTLLLPCRNQHQHRKLHLCPGSRNSLHKNSISIN